MGNHGFIRVGAAIPLLKVGNCMYNAQEIVLLIEQAYKSLEIQILCFPELCLTAYSCGDLFHQDYLLEGSERSVEYILQYSRHLPITFIIGAPVRDGHQIFNAALICNKGNIVGIVPKTHLPNTGVFYEKRWFSSALESKSTEIEYLGKTLPFGTRLCFGDKHFSFAVEICEDLWSNIPPSSFHALEGASCIFNLSASHNLAGKNRERKALIQHQSKVCKAAYVYASAGWGESSSDLVFTGHGFVYEFGELIAENKSFDLEAQIVCAEIDIELLKHKRATNTVFKTQINSESYRFLKIELAAIKIDKLNRKIKALPFLPEERACDEICSEILSIQSLGLIKRLKHTEIEKVVIGISGGLDSCLALLACVEAFDKLWGKKVETQRKNIIGVTMPGFGTSQRTLDQAKKLMILLGVSILEIDITKACEIHFADIDHDINKHDTTFENVQARERTQILMDLANKENALVVGTGDLSELALGWATYNGDLMSMYGLNAGIPKTLVKQLVAWHAQHCNMQELKDVLMAIVETPISPELLPLDKNGKMLQKTESSIGPYELHDFFLYHLLGAGSTPQKILFLASQAFEGTYDKQTIAKWLKVFIKRFFQQQFKRSCLPDGPMVISHSLSPRGFWKMPSDTDPPDMQF